MTTGLYLAANLVPQTAVFGHLQIVYQDATGNLLENETASPGFPYFFGDWVYPAFGRIHDNVDNTPGYGSLNDYAIVPLALRTGQDASRVWELLGQIHASLSSGGHGLNYDIDQNSNSYANTVLWAIGVDIGSYISLVTPPDVTGFPGVATNILFGAATGGFFSDDDTPIPLTLAGTAGMDFIRTGIGDDTLGGSDGNDEIRAGAGADVVSGVHGEDTLCGEVGNDYLVGDSGSDTLFGNAGDDRLEGGQGSDSLDGGDDNDELFGGGSGNDTLLGGQGSDFLFAENGNDVLDGGNGGSSDALIGGTGNDTLVGEAGADLFIFADGFGVDVINDFDEFSSAEKIDLAAVTAITDFTDLATNHLSQSGADAVITDGANTITLLNVLVADLGADDFEFLRV